MVLLHRASLNAPRPPTPNPQPPPPTPLPPQPVITVERTPGKPASAASAGSAGNAAPPKIKPGVFTELQTKAPGDFGCRLPQLVELISERGTDGMERLYQRFGGPTGLASKLKTDMARGISNKDEDIEERQHVFGANRTPDVRSKNLFELMWEAFQDPILIVLMVAAIISLILGIEVEDKPDTGRLWRWGEMQRQNGVHA